MYIHCQVFGSESCSQAPLYIQFYVKLKLKSRKCCSLKHTTRQEVYIPCSIQSPRYENLSCFLIPVWWHKKTNIFFLYFVASAGTQSFISLQSAEAIFFFLVYIFGLENRSSYREKKVKTCWIKGPGERWCWGEVKEKAPTSYLLFSFICKCTPAKILLNLQIKRKYLMNKCF